MEIFIHRELNEIEFDSRRRDDKARKQFNALASEVNVGDAVVIRTKKVIDYLRINNWARHVRGRKFNVRYIQPGENIYIFAIRKA